MSNPRNERSRQTLARLTASNPNPHNGGAGMAVKPNMGNPPEKSTNTWKSIGELARELAEKAGGK